MRITSFQATNMELTDAIRSYVEDKMDQLNKLTEEYGDAATLEVEVGKSSNHHAKGPFMRTEMMLVIPGKEFRAESEEEDLYASIDLTKDQLWRQLSEYKDKIRDAHRGPRPDKA